MIRKAKEKDIKKIMDLLVQVDMVHHNGRPDIFNGPATKYTKEQLLAIFADPQTPVFVSVDEQERVQGYAFCQLQQIVGDTIRTDIRTLYIDDLCVDETVRGQHIGTKLYEHVCRFAKEQGCYNVTLNVWTCNPSAMQFYTARGMSAQKIGMEQIL